MSTEPEKEFQALAPEHLAPSIIVGSVLGQLARNPLLSAAIVAGFDRAADVAQSVAVELSGSASPDVTVKALRIIEETRTEVLGSDESTETFRLVVARPFQKFTSCEL